MIVSTYDNCDSADSMTGEYSKLTKLDQSVNIRCRNVQLVKGEVMHLAYKYMEYEN
jgi:hypothetical protein